jgi:hypothetical protein
VNSEQRLQQLAHPHPHTLITQILNHGNSRHAHTPRLPHSDSKSRRVASGKCPTTNANPPPPLLRHARARTRTRRFYRRAVQLLSLIPCPRGHGGKAALWALGAGWFQSALSHSCLSPLSLSLKGSPSPTGLGRMSWTVSASAWAGEGVGGLGRAHVWAWWG